LAAAVAQWQWPCSIAALAAGLSVASAFSAGSAALSAGAGCALPALSREGQERQRHSGARNDQASCCLARHYLA
jgi:hypothetical protein